MRIVQIVGDMHNPSAGPSYSIARLADELQRCGEEVSVLTPGRQPASWEYLATLNASNGWLDNHLGISPEFFRKVRKSAQQSDILHGHGLWRFANNMFPLMLDRNAPARIVCSPEGTMSAWSMKYKSALKKPFWWLFQKPALERCHCFHVTARDEYENVRRLGLRAPVAIIPNGVDIPSIPAETVRKRYVFFLGRIHPVKGVDMLIRAWPGVKSLFPDWELVIAGPLTGDYAREMQGLAAGLGGEPGIHFVGEVLGEEKKVQLSEASLFVLPSHSENFGIVVAEALAHGLPVVTTTGTPWAELTGRNCGWQVPPEQSAIASAMQDAMSRPLEELHAMGERGRDWMQQDYSWENVASMMLDTYQWLHTGNGRPGFVVTD